MLGGPSDEDYQLLSADIRKSSTIFVCIVAAIISVPFVVSKVRGN